MTHHNRNRRRKRVLNNYAIQAAAPYSYQMPVYPSPTAPTTVVSVQSLSAKNATVAKVQVSKAKADWSGNEYLFEAADSAKREQGDRFDPVTGELYAQGRAFKDLGEQMLREANRRVTKMTEELAAERNKPPRAQTRHRSLEEWQEILKKRRREEKEQVFKDAWGFSQKISDQIETAIANPSTRSRPKGLGGTVTSDHTAPEEIKLGNGQVLAVTDKAVTLYGKTGNPVVRWERS